MNKLLLSTIVWLTATLSLFAQDPDSVFGFESVQQKAQALAASPYAEPNRKLPKALQQLTYDDLRNIRFNPRQSIWRMERLPFQLQFLHRGGARTEKINVNWVQGARVEPIPFSRDLFNYEQAPIRGRFKENLGFNGLRIHYPLNSIEYLDELAVFQGASYFRALGKNLLYGLSARGLAVNVAETTPEEFPCFTDFWVEKPDSDAQQIKLYALLDSPSLTGAYEMLIHPGADTVMDIRVSLYARTSVENLGLAPLTSMFWFGENSADHPDDFRPEVHDSDGLLLQTGAGEWIWRPLTNPRNLNLSSFTDIDPKGFGLLQRDRDFSSYEDLEVLYQRHPSAWVEPIGNWGAGDIRLIEIPTGNEYADNIVAFWAPADPLTPDTPLSYSYRLHWFTSDPSRPPLSRVVYTRTGNSGQSTQARHFVIEFSSTPDLDRNNPESVEPVFLLTNGTLSNQHLQFNSVNGTWRVFFDAVPESPTQPVDLRCFLQSGNEPRSETWTYFMNP